MNIEDVADAAELQELKELRTAIEASSKEIDSLKQEQAKRDLEESVRNLVGSPSDWVSVAARDAAIKLMNSGDLVLENGALTVTNGQGGFVVGRNGLMSPTEYLGKFRADNPWFVKPVTGHQGSAVADPQTGDTHLRRLFGRKSDGKYANIFANESPGEYRRLRTIARSQKLL